MIWASFRLQRLQLLTLLGLLVVGVAAIALMRSAMLDEFVAKNLTACAALALDACTAEPDVVKDLAHSTSRGSRSPVGPP
ncbi:hypothetical protein CNX65_17085 [Actinosynnema pretiosum]|uniref:Two-component system sensor kinase n=2 Tax=Actinosynnema pretiosum TaxID=42197 RepID=A0A290Z6V3_9PSEU|nr:hypothetical protein CNX65_17085 [Actinosynnema pretiosum]